LATIGPIALTIVKSIAALLPLSRHAPLAAVGANVPSPLVRLPIPADSFLCSVYELTPGFDTQATALRPRAATPALRRRARGSADPAGQPLTRLL
jgi:hypothetical protein